MPVFTNITFRETVCPHAPLISEILMPLGHCSVLYNSRIALGTVK